MSFDRFLVCADEWHAFVCEGNVLPRQSTFGGCQCVRLFNLRPDAVKCFIVARCTSSQLNQQSCLSLASPNLYTCHASASF
jgi:hypothetical protein